MRDDGDPGHPSSCQIAPSAADLTSSRHDVLGRGHLRSPIGPRAWSFWVEMPISAPKPNSPPSTNRLEAFTSTAAASISAANRAADVATR